MITRFTIDGSNELENRLAVICERARTEILAVIPGRHMKALLVGGGYGRGEGGVLRSGNGDHPYNDLEFYVLLSIPDLVSGKLYGRSVHAIAASMTTEEGIDIEFKILSLRKLERSPVTMFYYDLLTGHRLLFGNESWLTRCDQHRAAHRIPLHEGTRLLMNRCSGLLFAQQKLLQSHFSKEDADFVGRNLAKAKLALGDTLLTMRGQYHWSCRERHKRLRKLDGEGALQNFSSVVPLHAQGLEFKLHPIRSDRSQGDLSSELKFLKEIAGELWLNLESRRLNGTFSTVLDYCFDPDDKCPETNSAKNRLINLRCFGASGAFMTRYPRERMLNAFPLLLWHPEMIARSDTLEFVQRQLRTKARSYSDLVRAYESLWKIYN